MRTGRLSYWRSLTGLDTPVLATLLFRGWGVLAGALTLLLLPFFINPIEQGYYYTFASMLAMQLFFELGLNQIITQLAGHEAAHLTRTDNGQLTGDPHHLNQLSGLVQFVFCWYKPASTLFVLAAGTAGFIFFSAKGTLPYTAWIGPWLALVLSTGINLWFSPQLALIEGCAMVGQVARLRLMQSCVGYAALWGCLLSGGKLWATVAVPLTGAIMTALWLRKEGSLVGWLFERSRAYASTLKWRSHIFPLQWRIALSWMCGYFIFYLFTPILFAKQGPTEAGRFGMAMALFNAILNVGMSWVGAKIPDFSMHISRGERKALNTLFMGVSIRSTLFTALTCFAVITGVWTLSQWHITQLERLASVQVLACLAVVTIVNSVVFAAATYMRAHREEPMLAASIVGALLTVPAVYLGAQQGTLTMATLYMAITVFMSLPWTLLLFNRYYRKT